MTNAAGTPFVPDWTVGDRLRKARESAGIKPGVMAELLGRSTDSVARYERSRVVQLLVAKVYARETNVPLAWLLTGDDTPPDAEALSLTKWYGIAA